MTPSPGSSMSQNIDFESSKCARLLEVGPRFLPCYFLLFFRLIELSIFLGGVNMFSPSMSPILRERKSPDFLELLSIS